MAVLDDIVPNNTLMTLRHYGVSTTVYSVNVFYSALKDYEDNVTNMAFDTIITAETQFDYTFRFGWFIDNESIKYLTGGSISTVGYVNRIESVVLDGSYINAVASDIGKQVNNGGDVGELLHYDNALQKWWVRTNSAPATIANNDTLTITTGTGVGDAFGASIQGESLWTNIFKLGVLTTAPAPQTYIYQNRVRILEWSDKTNWERGQDMDVLIKVIEDGVTIDGGIVEVFVRQAGTTFDRFQADLSGGGRQPAAINASIEDGTTSAHKYILYNTESSGPFVVGDIIEEGDGTNANPNWYAEVIVVVDNGTEGYLGIRSINEITATIADSDQFTVFGGSANAVVNGTPGSLIVAYDNETTIPSTLGQVMTSAGGTKRILRGVQDDGSTGLLCLETNDDYQEDSTFFDDFVEDENLTGASDGDVDVDLATANAIGVAEFNDIEYWHIHGTQGTSVNTLTEGVHCTQDVTGFTGILAQINGSTLTWANTDGDFNNSDTINDDDSGASATPNASFTKAHTETQAFSQGTLFPYDIFVECRGHTVSEVYEHWQFSLTDASQYTMYPMALVSATLTRRNYKGEEYITAYYDDDTLTNTYTLSDKRTAPLGTISGGTIFGARGIWLQNMANIDASRFRLIDSNAIARTPPVFIIIKISNVAVPYQAFLAIDDGTTHANKLFYSSHASNNTEGSQTFEVDGSPSIVIDTPDPAVDRLYVRVTDDDSISGQVREARYKVASWIGNIFTLTSIPSGTTDGTGTSLQLIDSTATFITEGVEVGMMVQNLTENAIGSIASVDSETQITLNQLEGGNGDFVSEDTYEINRLITSYVAADNAYTPYIDQDVESGTEVSVTVIYNEDRTLIGRIRLGKTIISFKGSANLTIAGGEMVNIITPDIIAT